MQHALVKRFNCFLPPSNASIKYVLAIEISKDSRFIYVGDDDGIAIFDSHTGALSKTIKKIHQDSITSMRLNRDNTKMLTASMDGTVKIVRLSDGATLLTFLNHTLAIWSNSNEFVFTFFGDYSQYEASIQIRQYDAESGPLIRTYEGVEVGYNDCIISRDDAFLVAGNSFGTIALFDTSNSARIRQVTHIHASVTSLQWVNDRSFVSAHHHGACGLYSFPGCQFLRTYYSNNSEPRKEVWMAPDSIHFVTAGYDKRIRVWHVEGNQPLFTSEVLENGVRALSGSPDGKYIVCVDVGLIITKYDVNPQFLAPIESFRYFQSLMLLQRLGKAIPKHVMIIVAGYTGQQ